MTNELPPYPGEPDPSADEPTDAAPPSHGSAPPPGGGQYYPPPPPGGYPPPAGYAPPTENNTKAIWSMILGILSIPCCGVVLGPIAIVLSNQAKTEIRHSQGWQTGGGMATAGLVLGIIGIVVWVANIAIRIAQYA